jgi:multiple sugar transport system permease protein
MVTVSWTRSRVFQRYLRQVVSYALLLMGLAWFMYPLAWMFLGSFKTFADINQIPPKLLPSSLYLGNYPKAWVNVPFAQYFLNTSTIVALSVVGDLLSSSLVGFGFSRLRFWGRNFLFGLMLSTMMLPFWVIIIPQFIIYRRLGFVNTWVPLILPSYFGVASYIFLMRQFFLTLPVELDEAAELDGCGKVGIYARILMPLCKPVLAAITIFTFMSTWNNFIMPVIYLSNPKLYTVSIGLAFLRYEVAQGEPTQGLLMAATVFTSLPMVAVFFLGQRYMVRGITLTGRAGM